MPAVGAEEDADRQVVTTATTATAVLAVEDPADGAQRVSELVESAGGGQEARPSLRVDRSSPPAPAGLDGWPHTGRP